MTQKNKLIYQAEMGFTHKELLRQLASAVYPFTVSKIDSLIYRINYDKQKAMLYLSEQSSRKIASMELPVTHIMMQFENFNQQQYDEFIDRFKRYLHRGGG